MLPHGGVILDRNRSPFGGVFEDDNDERRYFWEEKFLAELPFLRAEYVRERLGGRAGRNEVAYLEGLHHDMLRGVAAGLLCDVAHVTRYGTKAHTDLELLFELFPHAKVLHIVRDGRDVCVSKRHHSFRRGTYFHGDERHSALKQLGGTKLGRRVMAVVGRQLPLDDAKWFVTPDEMASFLSPQVVEKFAGDWNAFVSYGLKFQDRYPDRVLTLRFEDLKADGAEACRRTFEFLEVSTSEATVDAVLKATDFKRLKKQATGDQSFFRGGRKGDWQRYFSDTSMAQFMRIAGENMKRLGYLDANAGPARRAAATTLA